MYCTNLPFLYLQNDDLSIDFEYMIAEKYYQPITQHRYYYSVKVQNKEYNSLNKYI